MRIFNSKKAYSTPPYATNFTKVGSPWRLIDQIYNREEWFKGMSLFPAIPEDHDMAMKMLYGDVRKIKPFATDSEIAMVLNSRKLDQGQTLWLMNEGGHLVLTDNGPDDGPEGKTHRVFQSFRLAANRSMHQAMRAILMRHFRGQTMDVRLITRSIPWLSMIRHRRIVVPVPPRVSTCNAVLARTASGEVISDEVASYCVRVQRRALTGPN